MPAYLYHAVDREGKKCTGHVNAASSADALQRLKAQKIFPTKIEETQQVAKPSTWKQRSRVHRRHIPLFTRQLAMMLQAGVPLVKAMRTLSQQPSAPAFRPILENITTQLESGVSFSQSLSAYPQIFSHFYIQNIQAGEVSGALDTILPELATFLEKEMRLQRRLQAILIYPAILLFLSVAILAFLLFFLVPRFQSIFAQTMPGKPLPWLTESLIALSQGMISITWPVPYSLMTLLAVVGLYSIAARSKRWAEIFDRIKLSLPCYGPLWLKNDLGRITRTLGVLLHHRVPILNAVKMGISSTSNKLLVRIFTDASRGLEQGRPLSQTLAKHPKIIPLIVVQMIQTGESTGRLEQALLEIGRGYENETETQIQIVMAWLEPALLLVVGTIVGITILGLFMPLINLMGDLSNLSR